MLIAIPFFLQQPREGQTGELAALIGVENLRLAVSGQRFIYRVQAELRFQRDLQPLSQNPPAEPIHHRRIIARSTADTGCG